MRDKARKGEMYEKRCPGGECLIDSLLLHIASKRWLRNKWRHHLQANVHVAWLVYKNQHTQIDLHPTVIQQHHLQEISVLTKKYIH